MLLLTSTSDIVRIVTGSGVTTIGVHASWLDNASGSITPGRTNTNITTAATTTVVGSPAASTQRNVRELLISNNSAASPTLVTVQHFDGTTSVDLCSVNLLAGENLMLSEDGAWRHHDATGAEYFYQPAARPNLGPTGTLAETMPREFAATTNNAIAASGTLFLQAIYLTAGQTVSNIQVFSGSTAAATTTHLLFGLYSSSLALLATSADQGAYTWAANTVIKLAMTTPYKVPISGLYYIGVMQAATTIATLLGGAAKLNAIIVSTVPVINGTSTTALTTALPSTAAAITATTTSIYAAVS